MTITLKIGQTTKTIPARQGDTLLAALQAAGVPGVLAPCGGQGKCGKCRVTLADGQALLVCQTAAEDGMTVILPAGEDAPMVQADSSLDTGYTPDGGAGYAAAWDLGTTTLVGHLLRRSDGARLATVSGGNPQAVFGADVIARISACQQGKLDQLRDLIAARLQEDLSALCRQGGIAPEQVQFAVLAGNTVMSHLVWGLDPTSIGFAPYTPLSLFGELAPAGTLLPCPVWTAPCLAGYVGGDILAGMIAAGLHREVSPWLYLDVGTNGEMALGCGEDFLCCAAAAGPAFEGAEISQGMTAARGAVCKVDWLDGQIVSKTVEDAPPIGVCGSGLIDALALLLDLGAVDETGRLLDPEEAPLAIRPWLTGDGRVRLTADGSVCLTQGDIRKLQLAKGAIRAGLDLLLEQAHLTPEDLAGLTLAGGFGSHIRPRSAARIGLFPPALLGRTRAVGNAAGEGAAAAAISSRARRDMLELREHCRYLELSTHAGFSDRFMDAIGFDEQEEQR